MITVPLTITARNEARAVAACLRSLRAAIEVAEAAGRVRIEPLVVADACTDDTAAIARAHGFSVRVGRGGKVEAQRLGVRPGPFQIFSDADIVVTDDTLHALCAVMLDDPSVAVAFPPKRPLPPRRRDPLAWSLYVYNRRRGFSSQRSWFSGKLFAIREWSIPTRDELRERAAALGPNRFYDYAAGMRIDDIYLSRRAVARHGLDGLRETSAGLVSFRAPETARGMYRYYRRMRMELERLDRLCPETRAAHVRHGQRRADRLREAPWSERISYGIFQVALAGCRIAYRAERAYYERWAHTTLDPWPAVDETKDLSCDSPSPT